MALVIVPAASVRRRHIDTGNGVVTVSGPGDPHYGGRYDVIIDLAGVDETYRERFLDCRLKPEGVFLDAART